MISGILFEQGDILIVPFPFSDLSSIKQRPVLVLSHTQYNRESNDIITCGITSNIKDTAYSVQITAKDLVSGNLPVASRIKVDKLFTLEKGIVKKRIGRIHQSTFERVKKELHKLV